MSLRRDERESGRVLVVGLEDGGPTSDLEGVEGPREVKGEDGLGPLCH